MSKDLLFELLSEELPPRTLLTLSGALTANLTKAFAAKGLPHGAVHAYATPRRLAVWVQTLAEQQPDRSVERRGPPLAGAFDAGGQPTQAATAFARSCGVAVEALSTLQTDKGAWLQYRGTERGAQTAALLPDIVVQAVAQLPVAKRMRWGANTAEFVRPVHGVVLLFGDEVVDAEVLGLKSGRSTRGHRFHAPKPFDIKNGKAYAARLRRAYVIADFAARRAHIHAQVTGAALELGEHAHSLIEAGLLDEVTALCEWPVCVTGRFDARFLQLPREVVIATVQDHQRYFPVQDADGALSNGFITIANIESRDPAQVRAGNERVVRPRLSDAAFFYEQDRRLPLSEHAAALAGMTFQSRLGSYADKTRRIAALAQHIGQRIDAGAEVFEAGSLCKADLMTAMVGEFPELQGTMGRYYAQAEGQPAALAQALEEHYRPRFAGDGIPASPTGQAVALADKLDTLVGIFAIEQRPTGAKDPFGLRRAALGVLRILIEARLDLDLVELLTHAAAAQPVKRTAVVGEVYDFIAERLRGMLLEQPHTSAEMLDAVLANRPSSPLDAVTRLDALRIFLTLPDAPVLAALNKRIANILKRTQVGGDVRVDAAALHEPAERALHEALQAVRGPATDAAAERRYAESLQSLTALRAPVDAFFETVMVMDENPARRNNRLALLRDAQLLLSGVADLSRLPG